MDDRLARIEQSVAALARGLLLMTETLDRHGAMLAAILEAATRQPPPSELPPAVRHLAETLAANTQAMETMRDDLISLPERIADAVSGRT